MSISISDISDSIRSDIATNNYNTDNFTAQYKVDNGEYIDFTSDNTGILKNLEKNEYATIIVKYSVLQDTVSFANLSTSFKLDFFQNIGVFINNPLVLNSNPIATSFNGEPYNTTLSTENGILLPNTVILKTLNDVILTEGIDYTYTLNEDATSATLSVFANKIYQFLYITCNTFLMLTPTLSDTTMTYNSNSCASEVAFRIPTATDFVATLTSTNALDENYFHDIEITIGETSCSIFDIVKSFSATTLTTTLTIPSKMLIGTTFIDINCCDSWDGTNEDLLAKGWFDYEYDPEYNLEEHGPLNYELNNNLYLNNEMILDNGNGLVKITDGINTIYVSSDFENMGMYYIDTIETSAIEHIENTTQGHYYEEGTTLFYRTDLSGDFSTINIWTPIGEEYTPFNGSFNGNNYKVSGVFINNENWYQGLFGYVANADNEIEISNVGVKNSYIKGGNIIGGICGDSSTSFINCYNNSIVCGSDSFTGGVCGIGGTSFTNCYNTGNVSGEYSVGGVCGNNDNLISNCYNTGSVSGIEDIYVGAYIGGVCGHNYKTITNCYYLEGTCEDNGLGSMLTSAQMKISTNFTDWDFSTIWQIVGDAYPTLRVFNP